MKWMIASDIHGSAKYCEKMIERYRAEEADRLLLLGDILYHGPRNQLPDGYCPEKVIAMLNGMKNDLVCVRGNCEAEVDQWVLDFPVMAEYAMIEMGQRTVLATHGHHYNEAQLPPLRRGDILLNGHTHVPKHVDHGDYIYLNPGSVSLPKENSPHSYIIYSDGVFAFKTIDGEEYDRLIV